MLLYKFAHSLMRIPLTALTTYAVPILWMTSYFCVVGQHAYVIVYHNTVAFRWCSVLVLSVTFS